MNSMFKRSIFTTVLFGFLFFFFIIFFTIVGQKDFMTERIHNLINSLMIFIVMISYYIMLKVTGKQDRIIDERDFFIQKQATSIGMTITAMLILITAISLFVINEESGVVYVSWMWLFAFGTFAFTYFITSLLIVIIYKKND